MVGKDFRGFQLHFLMTLPREGRRPTLWNHESRTYFWAHLVAIVDFGLLFQSPGSERLDIRYVPWRAEIYGFFETSVKLVPQSGG